MGKFILMLLISSIFGLNADAQDAVPAKMEVKYLVSYVAALCYVIVERHDE